MSFSVLKVERVVRWVSLPSDGGRYDMTNACPTCGAGAVRIDPLFATASACKEGVSATHKLQVVVSRAVYERLISAGVTALRQLTTKKGEPIDFWSLEPQVVLPPWSKESRGFTIDAQCGTCRRDGHFDVVKQKTALIYERLPAADVLATWEHYGLSRLRVPFEKSIFAVPRLIVSERVRRVLEGFRGVEFDDVNAEKPNQAPEPTPPAVTDRADARSAPAKMCLTSQHEVSYTHYMHYDERNSFNH